MRGKIREKKRTPVQPKRALATSRYRLRKKKKKKRKSGKEVNEQRVGRGWTLNTDEEEEDEEAEPCEISLWHRASYRPHRHRVLSSCTRNKDRLAARNRYLDSGFLDQTVEPRTK